MGHDICKACPPRKYFWKQENDHILQNDKNKDAFFVNLKKQLFLSTLVFGLKYSHLLILTNNIFLGAL